MVSRSLTQVQLAERLHIGQGTVAKALALLALPGPIQASVDAGEIGPDAAYQLTRIADPDEQAKLAREAAEGRLKRDELKERSSTPRKSRGGGKVRKVTSRIFRTSAGPRITVEHKRSLTAPWPWLRSERRSAPLKSSWIPRTMPRRDATPVGRAQGLTRRSHGVEHDPGCRVDVQEQVAVPRRLVAEPAAEIG